MVRKRFEELWLQRPEANADIANDTANKNWELLGQNAAAGALNAGGGILATMAGGTDDGYVVRPHLDTAQSLLQTTTYTTAKASRHSTTVSFPTLPSDTATVFQSGFTLDPTVFTTGGNDDQAVFRFCQAESANWRVVTSNADTDEIIDTGIAVAAATQYELDVEFDPLTHRPIYRIGIAGRAPSFVARGAALDPAETAMKPAFAMGVCDEADTFIHYQTVVEVETA